MPILIIFAVAGLLYLLQDQIYRRFWSRHLHADVEFTDHFIHEGESTELIETLSNGKILPLPWVYVKFKIHCNGKVEHYRSDLFSIRFYQKIRRRIPFQFEKRGVYTIRGIDLISNNLFITSKFVKVIEDGATMVVYPRLISTEEFQIPFQKMMGDIITRRFMIEDPFMFKGIREYQPYDSFKTINFKASARAGEWLVNVNDYTVSQKVTVLLNMDRANQHYDMRLYENSIRLAASMANAYEQEGIPVALRSNGRDVLSGGVVSVEDGCGAGHIHTVFESLARMEVSLDVEDFSPVIRAAAEDVSQDSMYLLISPFFGKACIDAFLRLKEVHASALWILPVTPADMMNPEFRGTQLAQKVPDLYLWKVE